MLCAAFCAGCGDSETTPLNTTDTPTAIVNLIDAPTSTSDLTSADESIQLVARDATPSESALYELAMQAITDTVIHLTASTVTTPGGSAFHGVLRELPATPTRTITIPCANDTGAAAITISGAITPNAIAADITASFAGCAIALEGSVNNQTGCTVSATLDGEIECTLEGASDTRPLNLAVKCHTPRACAGLRLTTAGTPHTFGTIVGLVYQKELSGVMSVQDAFAPTGFACIDSVGLSTEHMLPLSPLSAAAVGCE